jgi:hypothetical protein
VKDLRKVARDAVELWQPNPFLVILSAAKNLALYPATALFSGDIVAVRKVVFG